MKLSPLKKLIFLFIVSGLIVLGAVLVSLKTSTTLHQDIEAVENSYEVIYELNSIENHISSLEGSVRGYFITGNKSYIDNYDSSIYLLKKKSLNLKESIKENTGLVNSAIRLNTLVSVRILFFDSTITYKKNGGDNDANFIGHYMPRVRKYSDSIKAEIAEMKIQEHSLLKRRQDATDFSLVQNNIVIPFAGGICILLIIAGIFSLKNDIRKQREIETELRNLNTNKNKFFSIISHDLRGPINAMVKILAFLEDSKIKEEEKKQIIKIAQNSSKNVSSLLDNLLKWSSLQMNTINFHPERINIKTIVEANFVSLKSQADNKKIILLNSIEVDAFAFADRNMIDGVIRNLISNAIKFTRKEGEIIVSTNNLGSYLEVCVKDNGVGMSDYIKEHIFSLVRITSVKGTDNEEGSGLGLLLCKEFIEKNGGNIVVESKEEKGSTFKFQIPINDHI